MMYKIRLGNGGLRFFNISTGVEMYDYYRLTSRYLSRGNTSVDYLCNLTFFILEICNYKIFVTYPYRGVFGDPVKLLSQRFLRK